MTVVWYYVLPMLLGRTYDMKSDAPGVDIFPKSEIDNAAIIQRQFTDSQYRIVTDEQEARDFLDVSGDLSLKIKSGRVNIEGLGSYMKEGYSRSNTVEILVKVHYETLTYTLPSTAKPRQGWRSLNKVNIGTHYVRSITYGGDLVASLRFTSKSASDREKIRAVVQANLQSETGSFGLGIAGNFSQLEEDLKESASLEINYYATVPLKGVPNTMESLIELVEIFPEQTQMVGNGTGVPLRMELFPLTSLDSDLPRYLETKALVDQLDLLETQFDDIRATKRSLQEWLLNIPPLLPQKMEDEIGEFNDQLEKISAAFYEVMGNLNLASDADIEQFQPAFKAYEGADGINLPDKYYRKFTLLKHKIYTETPDISLDITGTSYIHWGRKSCNSSNGATTVYSGIVAGTDRVKGGASNMVCVNGDPQWDSDTKDIKKHPRFYSKFGPIHIRDRENLNEKQVACSECLVSARTSAVTFPSRSDCPKDWTLEYSGVMVTKDFQSRKGDFICMDSTVEAFDKEVISITKADRFGYMADPKISCGTLPCDVYVKDSVMPCAVCTY